MIAIDVTMAPADEIIVSPVENFLPLDEPRAQTSEVEVVKEFYTQISNFFKNCIDKNFILNTVNINTFGSQSQTITRYYATTSENAQAFQDAFTDMDAEFSMKKLWSQHGFTVSLQQSEIDFDLVEDNFDLVGHDGEVWNVKY